MSKGRAWGVEPNIKAMLAYLFGFIGGLLFLTMEKDNRFVRFHSAQSVALDIALIALLILSMMMLFIGPLLQAAILIGAVLLKGLMMIKAYQNEFYRLPVIGSYMARRFDL